MSDTPLNNVDKVIEAFGGVGPMAKALGVPVSTVQDWKDRGTIPIGRRADVRAAAREAKVDLDAIDSAEDVQAEKVTAKTDAGIRAAESARERPPVLEKPPESRPTEQRRLFMMGGALALALLVGAVLMWVWLGPVGGGGKAGNTAELERRFGELEKRLQAAEAAARNAGATATSAAGANREVSRVAKEVGRLEQQLTALQQRLRTAAGQDSVNQVLNRLTATEATLKRLGAEVKEVGRKAAATAAAQGDPKAIARLVAETGALGKRIDDQVKRIDDYVKSLNTTMASLKTSGASERAAIEKRLSGLEAEIKKLAAGASNRAAALLAIGQLRQAASGRGGYAEALRSAQSLLTGQAAFDAPLKALAAHAENGAPTLADLRGNFDPLTPRLVRSEAVPEDGDWLDRAWARLSSLVVVRRTGRQVTGAGVNARIAQAEVALRDGRLKDAVGHVAALPPRARKVAAGWLKDARARLAIDAALAELARASLALARGGTAD